MEFKTFLKKVVLFILIFGVLNAGLIGAVYIMANNVSFKLPQNKHVLILGDSHTALALNDKYTPEALNMSSEGEAYLYSYLKLKKFLAANKQIDTVLLSYNFLSIYKIKDTWINGPGAIENRISHYASFFGSDEFNIFSTNPDFYIAALRIPIENKRGLFKLIQNKLKLSDLHLGAYVDTKEKKLLTDMRIRDEHGGKQVKPDGFSSYQIDYLQKIVKVCRQKNIKLILLNTPIYPKAMRYYDTTAYYAYYNKYLNDISLWDCHDFDLPPDAFRDVEHLNATGAKQFSIFIDQKLKQ